MKPIKRMTVAEFRKIGGVQEINRCFLHPLGLALEVLITEDGLVSFGEIWDFRDDPEGILYPNGVIRSDHIARFEELRKAHEETRKKILGGTIIQNGDILKDE